jgi:hypothetical protein
MKIDILQRKQVVLSLVKLFGIDETAVRIPLGALEHIDHMEQ